MPARIREQWVAERFTAAELLVGVRVVGADPHDLGVEGMEALQVPLKALGLDRAAFGEIARIEIEDQPLPVEVTQAPLGFDGAIGAGNNAGEREWRCRQVKLRQGTAHRKSLPGTSQQAQGRSTKREEQIAAVQRNPGELPGLKLRSWPG